MPPVKPSPFLKRAIAKRNRMYEQDVDLRLSAQRKLLRGQLDASRVARRAIRKSCVSLARSQVQ